MDVFSWSVPFLAEKVTNMLYHILKQGKIEEVEDEEGDFDYNVLKDGDGGGGGDTSSKKKMAIRSKINSVARISRMFTTLREESEMLLKIKNICPDGKIPRGLLLEGRPAIKNGNNIIISYYI